MKIDGRVSHGRRDKIIRILSDAGRPVSIKDIAAELGLNYSAAAVFLHRMETREKSIIRVEPSCEGYVLKHDYDTIIKYAIDSMGFMPNINRARLAEIWTDGFYVGSGRKEGDAEAACDAVKATEIIRPACCKLWRKGFVHGRGI